MVRHIHINKQKEQQQIQRIVFDSAGQVNRFFGIIGWIASYYFTFWFLSECTEGMVVNCAAIYSKAIISSHDIELRIEHEYTKRIFCLCFVSGFAFIRICSTFHTLTAYSFSILLFPAIISFNETKNNMFIRSDAFNSNRKMNGIGFLPIISYYIVDKWNVLWWCFFFVIFFLILRSPAMEMGRECKSSRVLAGD